MCVVHVGTQVAGENVTVIPGGSVEVVRNDTTSAVPETSVAVMLSLTERPATTGTVGDAGESDQVNPGPPEALVTVRVITPVPAAELPPAPKTVKVYDPV